MSNKSKKLAMIPAPGLAVGMVSAIAAAIPEGKKVKKLTLPPLLKPAEIPIGQTVSGEIVALTNTISSRPDMRESKLIHLINRNNPKNPVEFLLPLTGTIKKAIGGNEGVEENIGKTLYVTRQADGKTSKYGDKEKVVFMFDVYIETE